jgi:hypothetical protein
MEAARSGGAAARAVAPTIPPPDAVIFPLSLPLFVSAGPVHGTAVAAARGGDDMYYLVDNAPAEGPPLWVHEAAVDRCHVAPTLVKEEE